MNGLPYLDRIEPEQIDVLLITHFHLDHAGEYQCVHLPIKSYL